MKLLLALAGAGLLACTAFWAEPGISPEDGRNIVAYTRGLQDKPVEVASQALSQLEPARLSWSSGIAHFAMNRREFTSRGVILGVNPAGRSIAPCRVAGRFDGRQAAGGAVRLCLP